MKNVFKAVTKKLKGLKVNYYVNTIFIKSLDQAGLLSLNISSGSTITFVVGLISTNYIFMFLSG